MNEKFKLSKEYSVANDIWSLLLTISVLAYLIVGFGWHIWHPTWIIFILAVVVSIGLYVMCRVRYQKRAADYQLSFDKQFEASHSYSKCVKISGSLFILSIVCYCIVSSFTGLWHPMWLIFLGMAVLEQLIALIFKLSFKAATTVEEKSEEK